MSEKWYISARFNEWTRCSKFIWNDKKSSSWMQVCIVSLYSKQTFTNFYYYNNICSYRTTIHCQKTWFLQSKCGSNLGWQIGKISTCKDIRSGHNLLSKGRENIMSSSVPNIDKNWVNKLVKFPCVKPLDPATIQYQKANTMNSLFLHAGQN